MTDLNNLLLAYQCNKWNSSCAHCPYGYGYLNDRGDNTYWSCDSDRIADDMFAWLSIYQYLIDSQERNKNV